jgi:hypothetical protein
MSTNENELRRISNTSAYGAHRVGEPDSFDQGRPPGRNITCSSRLVSVCRICRDAPDCRPG